MTAVTSTPFTALGGLVLVGVMFRMVLVLVENEAVVVMVELVAMMVLAEFIKPLKWSCLYKRLFRKNHLFFYFFFL